MAERVGPQLHQLASQVAHRGLERVGRGVGHEQVRDVLEHLADRRDQRARGEPATAIELDRDLDRRAGRHRVDHRVAADVERADQPAQVGLAELALDDRDAQHAVRAAPGHGLDGVVGDRPAGGQGRAALEVGLDVAVGERDAECARQRRIADRQDPARWSATAG